MSTASHRSPPRTTFRLILEERGGSWEVVFYDEEGRIRHISHSQSEIAALRAAYFIARYYNYTAKALMRTRHGDKQLDITQIMQNRRQG